MGKHLDCRAAEIRRRYVGDGSRTEKLRTSIFGPDYLGNRTRRPHRRDVREARQAEIPVLRCAGQSAEVTVISNTAGFNALYWLLCEAFHRPLVREAPLSQIDHKPKIG